MKNEKDEIVVSEMSASSDYTTSRKTIEKKKNKKNQWPFIFIFFIGLLILLYPQISRMYYRVESKQEIIDFEKAKQSLAPEEIKKRIELARSYNMSLSNIVDGDPYSEKNKNDAIKEYARMLEVKEKIGHVEIPNIDVDIPIYAGTSEDILQKGAGHLEGTSLPVGGKNTHTVITAHSGLPTAKLFSDIRKMKIGDKFYVHNIMFTMAYQVDQIVKIEPSNFKNLMIIKGGDYATLLTCTPIMINSHRLLVRGHRIPYVDGKKNEINKKNDMMFYIKCLVLLSSVILLFLFIIKKGKNNE